MTAGILSASHLLFNASTYVSVHSSRSLAACSQAHGDMALVCCHNKEVLEEVNGWKRDEERVGSVHVRASKEAEVVEEEDVEEAKEVEAVKEERGSGWKRRRRWGRRWRRLRR